MIEEKPAKEQVARLSCFDDFPKTKPGIKELVMAMMSAHSVTIATDLVDAFMGTSGVSKCPSPADIRRGLYEREPQTEPEWMHQPKPPVCPKCHGFGTLGNTPNVTWCDCPGAADIRADMPDWVDLCNRPVAHADPGTMQQIHPSWVDAGSRVRMATPRVQRNYEREPIEFSDAV